MPEAPINNRVIVSEDIFTKAAIRYCERMGIDPMDRRWARDSSSALETAMSQERDRLENLAESILALKEVGAI